MVFKKRARSSYGRGKYPKKRRVSGTAKRTASVKVIQAAVRRSLARKRRAATSRPKPVTNAKAIIAVNRKVNRLQKQLWGPVQVQRSYLDIGNKITSESPWCFHVTCPTTRNNTAPHVYHRNPLGVASSIGQFQLYDTGLMDEEDQDHAVNHPCYLKSILLEFQFEGFVNDTFVRVDIVRQKDPPAQDFYSASNSVAQNLLPKNLEAFTNKAGFTQDRIDRRAFEIVATRKLYFNSRPDNLVQSDLGDHLADSNIPLVSSITNSNYPMTYATTRSVQRTKIYIPYNRKLKPLDVPNQWSELSGSTDQHTTYTNIDDRGLYSYANIHPKTQLWAVLSTSDKTAIDAPFTGDAISCRIHRQVVWRDPNN